VSLFSYTRHYATPLAPDELHQLLRSCDSPLSISQGWHANRNLKGAELSHASSTLAGKAFTIADVTWEPVSTASTAAQPGSTVQITYRLSGQWGPLVAAPVIGLLLLSNAMLLFNFPGWLWLPVLALLTVAVLGVYVLVRSHGKQLAGRLQTALQLSPTQAPQREIEVPRYE
jgi:hypothetical protein